MDPLALALITFIIGCIAGAAALYAVLPQRRQPRSLLDQLGGFDPLEITNAARRDRETTDLLRSLQAQLDALKKDQP
jgi:hypothetical protein